jgi:DnaK suppressor protein
MSGKAKTAAKSAPVKPAAKAAKSPAAAAKPAAAVAKPAAGASRPAAAAAKPANAAKAAAAVKAPGKAGAGSAAVNLPAASAASAKAAAAKAASGAPARSPSGSRASAAVGMVPTTRINVGDAGAPLTSALQVAPKAVPQRPVVDPKDVAAATEYLIRRSATRSEEPVTVNGRRLLTEEQMLRMPEADYMNADQLAFFKHQLQQMERELLANAGETTEHLRETVIVPDPADRATIEEEHALELRTRDRERKLLKKVQASLARIDGGDYGFCEETGDPIGIPRLLARPTATLSLEAQQRREMKQKLYGD